MSKRPYVWITEKNGNFYLDFCWNPGCYIYRLNDEYQTREDAEQEIGNWIWNDEHWLMAHSKRA